MPTIEFVGMSLEGDVAFYNFALIGPGHERVGLIPIQTVPAPDGSLDSGKNQALAQLKIMTRYWANAAEALSQQ